MMAARVQALIGVAGETITYQRVTHGSYSTATLQSAPSVQSSTIKAGVRQYGARGRSPGWYSRGTGRCGSRRRT
jgi:hypothetical protein